MADACDNCGRPRGALATRCMYCGTVVPGASERHKASTAPPLREAGGLTAALAHEARMRRQSSVSLTMPCPGCERILRLAAGEPARCTYCALEFLPGHDALAPVTLGSSNGPLMTTDEAAALIELGGGDPVQLAAARALHARAQGGMLTLDEGRPLIDALHRLRGTTGGRHWLPIGPRLAEEVVPRLVFGIADASAARGPGHALIVPVVLRAPGSVPKALLALAALGTGNLEAEPANAPPRARRATGIADRMMQLHVELRPRDHGLDLVVNNQLDDEAPFPLLAEQASEVEARIAYARLALPRLLALAALFGPSCRGATPFMIGPNAIAARMGVLGLGADPALAEALRVRLPTRFPAP